MKCIYVVPVGEIERDILETLREAIEKRFKIECKVADPLEHPGYAYDSHRGQYGSTAILGKVKSILPRDALRVLGVADVDLYVPELNFVFGEAEIGGESAVISLYRLRPELYGSSPDEKLFGIRAVKEAVHELGHTFGLRHCPDPKCVMHFSNSLADTDIKSTDPCPHCESELNLSLERVGFWV